MLNPKLLKLMEGKYELLVQVDSLTDFVFLLQRILKDFYGNTSISLEDKKKITKALITFVIFLINLFNLYNF